MVMEREEGEVEEEEGVAQPLPCTAAVCVDTSCEDAALPCAVLPLPELRDMVIMMIIISVSSDFIYTLGPAL